MSEPAIRRPRVIAAIVFSLASLAMDSATAQISDAGVAQLRSDIRTLQREVRELARRVDQLQQARSAAPATSNDTRLTTAPDADPSAWIAPEKWDRVRPGMSAQEVILVLGTPVSMRSEGSPATRTLFYTLPIGDGGFLTGTVRLQDDKVLDVQRPTLK